ncbi:MAG: hypothetical protein RL497_1048 [Pseudomonadota bacterium]
MQPQSSTRLNKFISESGICSRREADRLIEQGLVYINGRRAKIGDQVSPGDKINANGQLLQEKEAEDFIFIACNKPVGITSTTEISDKTNIIDFVNHTQRIFPIGRLDKDSQGLIFLTNNGDIVNKILRAGNKHEKEYLVTVNKPITASFIEGMGNGVPILGEMTKKCVVSQESPFIFRIILIQGLNRQIRRMCEHFGYEATKLERVRIMNIRLKGLPLGEWRDLDEAEIASIFKMLEHSKSEDTRQGKNTQRPPKKPKNTPPRTTTKTAAGATKPKPTKNKPLEHYTHKKNEVNVKSKPGKETKNTSGKKATLRSSDWQENLSKKTAPKKTGKAKPAGNTPKRSDYGKPKFSSNTKPPSGRAGRPSKK